LKFIKKKFEEYKNQVVNLDYDAVQYYVERFDQIKSGLKSRVQRGDELVLTLLPKELKTEEALNKLFYIDILKWRKFRDLEKLIDGAFSKQIAKKKEEELVNSVETDADLIYSKNGIEIYKEMLNINVSNTEKVDITHGVSHAPKEVYMDPTDLGVPVVVECSILYLIEIDLIEKQMESLKIPTMQW
jgi:hypothetical protein